MILGYVFAVLATLASGSGSILESIGIRRAGAYGGRSLDLVSLRRQSIYFVGIGVDLVGFIWAAAALHRLPLFLVQSLLAFSVGVTATISAFLGTRLAALGWIALGTGALGLVLLGVSAEPGPGRPIAVEWRWVLLAMAVPIAGIAIGAKRRRGLWAAPLLAFSAGLGFTVVGISARTLDTPDSAWQLAFEPAVWAMALNGLTAAVVFALALQQGGATAVTAVMFTTNTAVSSLIGLVYLDDRVRPGFTTAAIAGFTLAIVGAVGVAHYSSIASQKASTPVAERRPVRT